MQEPQDGEFDVSFPAKQELIGVANRRGSAGGPKVVRLVLECGLRGYRAERMPTAEANLLLGRNRKPTAANSQPRLLRPQEELGVIRPSTSSARVRRDESPFRERVLCRLPTRLVEDGEN